MNDMTADTRTDERIGYCITETRGQYHLLERRLQVTRAYWGLWNEKRYYSLLIKPYRTHQEARDAIDILVAEEAVIVKTTDYDITGSIKSFYV